MKTVAIISASLLFCAWLLYAMFGSTDRFAGLYWPRKAKRSVQ